MCVESNEQSRVLPMENDLTSTQSSIYAEDAVSQDHRIVEHCKQEEHVRACIFNWAEVISELYDIGSESHVKRLLTCSMLKPLN